jgi:FkbM family methyltransferase
MTAGAVCPEWFDDRALVRQFPVGYRVLALTCRIQRRFGCRERFPGQWRAWVALARLQRCSGRGTMRLVTVAGTPIGVDFADPRAIHALREVRGINAEGRALRRLLGPGDSFVDIGANHGAYAMVASGLVGDEGAVLAFEPQPRLAGLLRRAFVAAGRNPDDVLQAACGDVEGQMSFHVPRLQSGAASMFAANTAHRKSETYSVAVTTIDRVLGGRPLCGTLVVKLDIEGAELAVLRGGRATLRSRKPTLLLELNPSTSCGAGFRLAELIAELEALGYRSAATVDQPNRSYPLQGLDLGKQRNVLVLAEAPTESAPER